MTENDARKRANREDCLVVWAIPVAQSTVHEKKLLPGVVIDLSKSELVAGAKRAMPRATEAALFSAALSDPSVAKRLVGSFAHWLVEHDQNPDRSEGKSAAVAEELRLRLSVVFDRPLPPVDSEWGCPAPCLVAVLRESPNLLISMPMSMRQDPQGFAEHVRASLEAVAREVFGANAVIASAVKKADTDYALKTADGFSALASFAWERRVLLDATDSALGENSAEKTVRPPRTPRSL